MLNSVVEFGEHGDVGDVCGLLRRNIQDQEAVQSPGKGNLNVQCRIQVEGM